MTKMMCKRKSLIDTAVFMLLLYGVSCFVYLNGDDFMYASFANTGILKNVYDYYFTGNGRFWINILDSALLVAAVYIVFLVIGRKGSGEAAVRIGKKAAVLASVVSLAVLIAGYASNAWTHEANIQRTENPQKRVIVLEELPDTTFSWYIMPMGEFHEGYYRILHEIPSDVEIVYQALPGQA